VLNFMKQIFGRWTKQTCAFTFLSAASKEMGEGGYEFQEWAYRSGRVCTSEEAVNVLTIIM